MCSMKGDGVVLLRVERALSNTKRPKTLILNQRKRVAN